MGQTQPAQYQAQQAQYTQYQPEQVILPQASPAHLSLSAFVQLQTR